MAVRLHAIRSGTLWKCLTLLFVTLLPASFYHQLLLLVATCAIAGYLHIGNLTFYHTLHVLALASNFQVIVSAEQQDVKN